MWHRDSSMKKALCLVSGMLLILAGCEGLFGAFLSIRYPSTSMRAFHVYQDYFYKSCFFTGPILIIAGGWLYSFKRAAWKLALVAHGITLLYLMAWNVLVYLIAVYMIVTPDTKAPFFFLRSIAWYLTEWHGGIFVAPKALLLLYGCSLSVLLVSRRVFKD